LQWLSPEEVLLRYTWNPQGNFVKRGDEEYQKGRPTGTWSRYYAGITCRAYVDGCLYPGDTTIECGAPQPGAARPSCGFSHKCKVSTKEKDVWLPIAQVLWNPKGAAKLRWRSWEEGTGNLNFPQGVVKSSDTCNLMVARYNDHNESAVVDDTGHVYYSSGWKDSTWYWDNNEYDLLEEKFAIDIQMIELKYDLPSSNTTTEEYKGDSSQGIFTMVNEKYNGTAKKTAKLNLEYTSSKSWSHSVEFGVSVGVELEVSSPGEGILGGVTATFGFEASYSHQNGWAGETSVTRQVEVVAEEYVPPRSRVIAKMHIMHEIRDIPFTAVYKVTYEDGESKIITDEGVLKSSSFANAFSSVSEPESID